MKRLLLCGFFLVSSFTFGQSFSFKKDFESDLYKSLHHLYSFQFHKADSAVKQIVKKFPNEPAAGLLEANYYWWLMVSGEDSPKIKEEYNTALAKAELCIKNLSKSALTNEDKYALITTYAFRARVEGLNKNYFKAVFYVNNSIDVLKQSLGKEEDYLYFKLTSGVYNYYVATADEHYPFLLPYLLFLPDADREIGLNFLEQAAASNDPVLQTEAQYFLMKIFMDEKKNDLAYNYSEALHDKYNSNLLYSYYSFKNLLKQNKKEEALHQLTLLNLEIRKNNELTEKQKFHFLNLTKKDLEKYYSKNQVN